MANWQQKIGFIGAGRMATALARGCVQAGLVDAEQVLAADPSDAARQAFADQVAGAAVTDDNHQVLASAETVTLAVKPQMMLAVLEDLACQVENRHLLVSIAAGITLDKMAAALPSATRLVRVMPNTPCLVGFGASCFCRGPKASENDGKLVKQMLESVGRAFEVEEHHLDVVTGLSGSGPAFVYLVIEALAAGGAENGLNPDLALELAAQTARGAAEMVLETKMSPAELRQQVTSPGGTTLAGLETLVELEAARAFRDAVASATRRSRELGQA